MAGVTFDNLDSVFTYHPPTGEAQLASYDAIRKAGRELARAILAHTTTCADQQAAIRKVREACFTANAAIALVGSV